MTNILFFGLLSAILLRAALSLNVSKAVDVTTAELSRNDRATMLARGSPGKHILMRSGQSHETLDNNLSKMTPVASDVLSSPSFDGNGTVVNGKQSVFCRTIVFQEFM
jgi:hypothetical protein